MTREREWLGLVLDVRTPWVVQDVQVDAQARRVSVVIGNGQGEGRKGWSFGAARASSVAVRRMHWVHLGLAGLRCDVQVALPEGLPLPDAPWAGDPELPFTHALSRQVIDLLLEGTTLAQLCRMLEVPLGDLWKYKFRLDQGRTTPPRRAEFVPASAAMAPPAPRKAGPAPDAVEAALVPPLDSPLWLAMLHGRLPLDVQTLGLRLLLSKLSREAHAHQDPDLHAQAARSIHGYFLRHRAALGAEIEQLRHLGAGLAESTIPDVSDPLWQELLSGERELDVRVLSLRLLLARLRQQAHHLRNDEVRMLKLVELHRYFDKHQAQLAHELAQIQRWRTH